MPITIAENCPLRLTGDQIINPEKALTELYPHFTLHNIREMLWEVFSRGLIVNDNELGAFSRADLLRCYTVVVQIVEAGHLVANDYKKAVETRNDFVHHR
jgi:hypothetical protein